MAIVVGYAIAVLGAVLAYQFGEGKSKKRKYRVWGFALMVSISPALSFAIGLTYAAIVGSGWASMIMWILFPIGFIVGLVMLFVGIFKKEATEEVL
ncbi:MULTISPECIES: hypothetical protein [Oceanobacillus]|uniref:hypothetical protein n=1 Tax=Oceanobacillus TaxID=182709 RepID=UPI000B4374ED|nr:hypothetical protein [Oceanobacillus rekensis]